MPLLCFRVQPLKRHGGPLLGPEQERYCDYVAPNEQWSQAKGTAKIVTIKKYNYFLVPLESAPLGVYRDTVLLALEELQR
jgi:hypothetical protein